MKERNQSEAGRRARSEGKMRARPDGGRRARSRHGELPAGSEHAAPVIMRVPYHANALTPLLLLPHDADAGKERGARIRVEGSEEKEGRRATESSLT